MNANFFDQQTYNELQKRVNKLKANTPALWGKMNSAQMCKHCQHPLQIALAQEEVTIKPNWLIKTFFKKSLYSKRPYSKNAPTSPLLIVADNREFKKEKDMLLEWMDRLYEDRENEDRRPHPLFGHFTKEQWGMLQWKHLDHHLRQFNV